MYAPSSPRRQAAFSFSPSFSLLTPVVAMLIMFVASDRAASQGLPRGLLESPRLGSVQSTAPEPANRDEATAMNLDREFTFTGWVDFPPDDGELLIDINCFGDGHSFDRILLKLGRPSNETREVEGITVWTFSLGPVKPFRQAVDRAVAQGRSCRPWQDGGTAQFEVLAHRFIDNRFRTLDVLDEDGIKVFSREVVLADPERTPVTQSEYDVPLYSVPAFLGKKEQTGTPEETETYYRSVFVDPLGQNSNLSIWTSLPELFHFRLRYFLIPPFTCPPFPGNTGVDFASATYFNKGDLGIGREMNCSYNDCTKETACYVKNFGTVDANGAGQPLFTTDKEATREAMLADKPFATVTMVSRGGMAVDDGNKVFFAVYIHPNDPARPGYSPLALEAPLDNRQHNKFIPGNCLVCHGTAARYDKETAQVRLATLLPFELQHAFDYYGADPSDPLSREQQETWFKRLNQIVARTDLYTLLPEARTLLNGFYDSPAPASDSDPASWRSPTFIDNFVPEGWEFHDDSRQMYRNIVAPYCRGCHVSHPIFHFGTFFNWLAFEFESWNAMCNMRDQNIMPNAEATLQHFWRSGARAHLVSRGVLPGCGLQPIQ